MYFLEYVFQSLNDLANSLTWTTFYTESNPRSLLLMNRIVLPQLLIAHPFCFVWRLIRAECGTVFRTTLYHIVKQNVYVLET